MRRKIFVEIGLRGLRSHARPHQIGLMRAKEVATGIPSVPLAYDRLWRPLGECGRTAVRTLDPVIRHQWLGYGGTEAASLQSFVARSLVAEPRMSAPFFLGLGPILAFLKSSFIVKGAVAVYAFVKSSFVFSGAAAAYAFLKSSVIFKFLGSALAYLKSGSAFKALSVCGRVVLGIVSTLKLQARRILRLWHGEADFKALNEAREQAYVAEGRRIPHFHRTTKYLLAVPAVIVVVAVAASLEQTPVTGRWRIIMMNVDEEARVVEDFLRAGSPPRSHLDWTVPRDWLAILRDVYECPNDPPRTVSGCRVLDPRYDWRARWVQDVLSRVEAGIKRANLTSENADRSEVFEAGDIRFVVPPVEHPLVIRPASLKHHGRSEDEHVEGPLLTHFGLLVLDSPEVNAASLGFGPGLQSSQGGDEEAPGVVWVHTGFLDALMQGTHFRPSEANAQLSLGNVPQSSSPVVSVFSSLVKPYSPSFRKPTKREEDQLAAILAHELAHLLLSHSLEGHSSDDMAGIMADFFADLARTALYPLTAFLGPVFNDWFGRRIRANSSLGLHLTNNCGKRQTEREADLVGLRILVGAGIDPRALRDLFAEDGVMSRAEKADQLKETYTPRDRSKLDPRDVPDDIRGGGDAWDGQLWLERMGYFRQHPHSEDRYRTMAEELDRWAELGREEKELAPASTVSLEQNVHQKAPTPL